MDIHLKEEHQWTLAKCVMFTLDSIMESTCKCGDPDCVGGVKGEVSKEVAELMVVLKVQGVEFPGMEILNLGDVSQVDVHAGPETKQ